MIKKKMVNIILWRNARNKYRNLWDKERDEKREYQRNRYHMNIGLNERIKQYQRDYYNLKIKK